MATEKETTTTEVESAETEVLAPSPEEKESSNDTTELEKETTETTEPEKTKESEEESFEDKLNRLSDSKAKSIADKSTQTITKDRDVWRERATKAEAQVNETILNAASNDMYGEELESIPEEDANKRKSAREKRNEMVLEYQKNGAHVEKMMSKMGEVDLDKFLAETFTDNPMKTVKDLTDSLNEVARDNKALVDCLTLEFPDFKARYEKVKGNIVKFSHCNDKKEYGEMLEVLKENYRAKTKNQLPDSSIQGGGGGDDLSNLPIAQRADALFKRAEEKAKKK